VWVESGEELRGEGKGGRDRVCYAAVVGLSQTNVEMLEMREGDVRVGERLDCFGSEMVVEDGKVEGDDFVEGDRSVEWSEGSELLRTRTEEDTRQRVERVEQGECSMIW
jgi:hypothetical protein